MAGFFMPKKQNIYLDYAAATPVDRRVILHMSVTQQKYFANSSSVHAVGLESLDILNKSRTDIAKILSVKSSEIFFTSSGTESNNLAIIGMARRLSKYGRHIIVSNIEHASILNACEYLKKEGFQISYLPVDLNGVMSIDDLRKTIRKDTILVSVMMVQNEVGTIQPLKEIGKIIQTHRNKNKTLFPLFHSDACQATGLLQITPHSFLLDVMTVNGAKCYGPKGIALLWTSAPQYIQPIIFGGGQERGLRSGTENIAAIAGFTKALEIAEKNKTKELKRLTDLKQYFIQKIKSGIFDLKIVAEKAETMPHIISIAFKNISGEMLVQALSQQGIYIASGAACSSHESGPSHVVKALKLPHEYRDGVIRISLGRQTTRKEIDILVLALKKISQ